jgi:hypothetical protein
MGPAELFETLTFEDIEGFVARRQEEHLHLDFKVIREATLASRDDRRNLACALSGFANSAGGLVVWGVDARRNTDGVDCATEIQPIQNVAMLVTRLNSLTGEALDPVAPGVRHRPIARVGGSGIALTLVPESDFGPHMAKLGEDRYYKRSGDGLYKMEHYDIADMFGRRRKPQLTVFYRVGGTGNNASVRLGIRNDGRATAHAPFFAFQNEGTLRRSEYGLDGNGTEGLKLLRAGSAELRWAYGGGMDFALHPGMAHEIANLDLGIATRPFPTQDLVIEYAVACVDQPLERGTLTVPLQELA